MVCKINSTTIFVDYLSKNLDKNHYERMRKYQRKTYEKGSGFWWSPGDKGPERLPRI